MTTVPLPAPTLRRDHDAYGHARMPRGVAVPEPERIDRVEYGRFRNVYLYITEACQLRCEHCYMGERLDRALKMPLPEIVDDAGHLAAHGRQQAHHPRRRADAPPQLCATRSGSPGAWATSTSSRPPTPRRPRSGSSASSSPRTSPTCRSASTAAARHHTTRSAEREHSTGARRPPLSWPSAGSTPASSAPSTRPTATTRSTAGHRRRAGRVSWSSSTSSRPSAPGTATPNWP